ncbi:proteasome assembly chaperone 4 family protein, partial [Pelotomaculum sp. FP]|uniref:proteasome assembly chaperone 4 family protein n=1 Tax=Pelotomaculum sp. FP TaxID=261474 RepID=UPI0018645627
IEIHKEHNGLHVVLQATAMGKDWNVVITGGEIPHLGSIALGIPRPSLQNSARISATVSVLTLTGHKEDEIVRPAAYFLASRLNAPVVVSCGIHNEQIKSEDIRRIGDLVQEALTDLLVAACNKDMR